MRAIGMISVGLLVALATRATGAELLEFARGGHVHLPVVVEGDVVAITASSVVYRFLREDFKTIASSPSPLQAWQSRHSGAESGDAQARYEAAWDALMNGMIPEAEAMLRSAHRIDPAHQPTARMVSRLDRLAGPCLDPDLAPYRRLLDGNWKISRGAHVVLFHQHGAREAAERIEHLERVTTSFYLFLSALGFDLPPPSRRLVSAWFAEQAGYLAFLRSQQADAFLTTRGYYHPTADLVAVYDARSDSPQRLPRSAISARRAALLRDDAIPGPARPPQEKDRVLRDLDRQLLLLDLQYLALDFGTSAHEMVHQLVAHTRFAPRADSFPMWLQEGFAAQFEVVIDGRWAGIGQPHPLRLADWRKAHPVPRLAPLLQDVGLGHGYQATSYAASWSLFDFLRREHPQSLIKFFDSLRNPDPTSPAEADALAPFRGAFGPDLTLLEREWHRHIARLLSGTAD